HLRTLLEVAGLADFRLCRLCQDRVDLGVRDVAGRAFDVGGRMEAAFPVLAVPRLVAVKALLGLRQSGGFLPGTLGGGMGLRVHMAGGALAMEDVGLALGIMALGAYRGRGNTNLRQLERDR